jgi:hypothetical protein
MPLYLFGEEPSFGSTIYSYDSIVKWNDWSLGSLPDVNEIVQAAVKMANGVHRIDAEDANYYRNINRDEFIQIGPSQLWIAWNSPNALSPVEIQHLLFIDMKVLTATRTKRKRELSMDKGKDLDSNVRRKMFEAMIPFRYDCDDRTYLDVAVHVADIDNLNVVDKWATFDILNVKEYEE